MASALSGWHRFFALRANAYYPFVSERQIGEFSQSSTAVSRRTSVATTWGPPFPTGHTIAQPFTTTRTTATTRTTTTRTFEQFEDATQGVDMEAAVPLPLPLPRRLQAQLAAGYYHYLNPYGSDLSGLKGRFEFGFFERFFLQANYYADREIYGSRWYLGAEAWVPIGRRQITPEQTTLTQRPERAATSAERAKQMPDFSNQLLSRVMRNPRIIWQRSGWIENVNRRTVRSSTSVARQQSTGTVIIANNLIFVDNNRGLLGNPGTWEQPAPTIQGGADLAVANLGTTGRVWTVWTQGGTGIVYNEDITALGSVHFTSSAIPIPAREGFVFGGNTGRPEVTGGFVIGDNITPVSVASITGYEITGGHGGFNAITFRDVARYSVSNVFIGPVGGDAIAVNQTNLTQSSQGSITRGAIVGPGQSGISFDFTGSGSHRASVSGISIDNVGNRAIASRTGDTSRFDFTLTNTAMSGIPAFPAYAVDIVSAENSRTVARILSNRFDGGSLRVDTFGSASAEVEATQNVFTNIPGAAMILFSGLSASATLVADNNEVTNSQSILQTTTATPLNSQVNVSLRRTQASNLTGDAILLNQFGGGSTNVELINNFIDNVAQSGIVATTLSGILNLNSSGNLFRNTGADAIVLDTTGSANQANVTMRNDVITDVQGTGVVANSTGFAGSTVDLLMEGVRVENTTGRGLDVQVTGSNTANIDLRFNRFANNTGEAIHATASNNGLLNIDSANNIVTNVGNDAVAISTTDNALATIRMQSDRIDQVQNRGVALDARDSSSLNTRLTGVAITNTNEQGIRSNVQDSAFLVVDLRGSRIEGTTLSALRATASGTSTGSILVDQGIYGDTGNANTFDIAYSDQHAHVTRIVNSLIRGSNQDGIHYTTADDVVGNIEIAGNNFEQQASRAIRMELRSSVANTATIRNNRIQSTGSAIAANTDNIKTILVAGNQFIDQTVPAVRMEREGGTLNLQGSSVGNNTFNQPFVPFLGVGGPFSDEGILINNVAYP